VKALKNGFLFSRRQIVEISQKSWNVDVVMNTSSNIKGNCSSMQLAVCRLLPQAGRKYNNITTPKNILLVVIMMYFLHFSAGKGLHEERLLCSVDIDILLKSLILIQIPPLTHQALGKVWKMK